MISRHTLLQRNRNPNTAHYDMKPLAGSQYPAELLAVRRRADLGVWRRARNNSHRVVTGNSRDGEPEPLASVNRRGCDWSVVLVRDDDLGITGQRRLRSRIDRLGINGKRINWLSKPAREQVVIFDLT